MEVKNSSSLKRYLKYFVIALPIIAILSYAAIKLLYQNNVYVPYYNQYKEEEVYININKIDEALQLYADEHIINGNPSYPKNLTVLVDEYYINYDTIYGLDTNFVYVAYPINKEYHDRYILRSDNKFDTDYIYSNKSIKDKTTLYKN